MTQYWVVGGQFADTKFLAVASGKKMDQLGPFSSYDEAHKVWASQAWASVDDCTSRYRIIKRDEDDHSFSTD